MASSVSTLYRDTLHQLTDSAPNVHDLLSILEFVDISEIKQFVHSQIDKFNPRIEENEDNHCHSKGIGKAIMQRVRDQLAAINRINRCIQSHLAVHDQDEDNHSYSDDLGLYSLQN